jgi:hypothetical protein
MADYLNIRYALSSLSGKSGWGLVRTHGSMFFLELGNPISRVSQIKRHGEWHVLVELCHWRFETADSVLVGSEDDPAFIDATFDSLELGSVDDAEVLTPSHDLQINFSSGIQLKTFTTSKEAKDQWTQWHLFGPDEHVWISDGGGNLKCKRRDEPIQT